MRKHRAAQFTLAGLMFSASIICMLMVGIHYVGWLPLLACLGVIPGGLFAATSVVFFRRIRAATLRWFFIITGSTILATDILAAIYRLLEWCDFQWGASQWGVNFAMQLRFTFNAARGLMGFAAYFGFALSLLLLAHRMQLEDPSCPPECHQT